MARASSSSSPPSPRLLLLLLVAVAATLLPEAAALGNFTAESRGARWRSRRARRRAFENGLGRTPQMGYRLSLPLSLFFSFATRDRLYCINFGTFFFCVTKFWQTFRYVQFETFQNFGDGVYAR